MIDTIILPLYGKNRTIPLKTNLNYWNSLHSKNKNAINIPIPSEVYQLKTDFFPHGQIFNLTLPNQNIIPCYITKSKTLMSKPSHILGKWFLRDVFRLPVGQIVTLDIIEDYGLDSIRIDKFENNLYRLHFTKIDSYQDFLYCMGIDIY